MIKHINGNLFSTKADIVCHQVNCKGVMGSGVALQVKQNYPKAYQDYMQDFLADKLVLGHVCFSEIENNFIIANLCSQEDYNRNYKNKNNVMVYSDYSYLQVCLNKVKDFCIENDLKTIAFPYKMSCDRGGGNWEIVYQMIELTFEDFNVEIYKL